MRPSKSGTENDIKLEEIDSEDLSGFLVEVEKSFGIEFGHDDFADVNTYGELSDVIMSRLHGADEDTECTKQQAFYKLRSALMATLSVNKAVIQVGTKMNDLVPRKHRIKVVRDLKSNLGVPVEFLGPPIWLVILTVIVFILSLIAFWFSWKIAIGGILLFVFMIKIGEWFGKEFNHQTVGGFARAMTHKHYSDSRRSPNSVNRKEIKELLDEMIAESFDVDKARLTRDAKFGWAK